MGETNKVRARGTDDSLSITYTFSPLPIEGEPVQTAILNGTTINIYGKYIDSADEPKNTGGVVIFKFYNDRDSCIVAEFKKPDKPNTHIVIDADYGQVTVTARVSTKNRQVHLVNGGP